MPGLGSRVITGWGLSEKNTDKSNMELPVEEVWELGAEVGWEEAREEAGAVES